METNINALYEEIQEAAFNFRKAMSNGIRPQYQVETMKNILFNNLDGIEAALKYASEASTKIVILETELDDAEREIDELTKKTTGKKKVAGDKSE